MRVCGRCLVSYRGNSKMYRDIWDNGNAMIGGWRCCCDGSSRHWNTGLVSSRVGVSLTSLNNSLLGRCLFSLGWPPYRDTVRRRWPTITSTMKLENSDQKTSQSAGKNTGIVLKPCCIWKCVPTAISGGEDISEVPGRH